MQQTNEGLDRVLRLIKQERDRANLNDRELERLAGLGRGTLTRVFCPPTGRLCLPFDVREAFAIAQPAPENICAIVPFVQAIRALDAHDSDLRVICLCD